ncbi:radical SAM family heme chaperone HemW [Corynebacterium sp. SCR221107]|uniref:radical SAM family heme chaperone HemW n=1 Tax=Corynebacterium sp. SCR221107 TaxID=3017361 RepID=UPI0022EC1B65|nr:radical SAM family heme chaperone HemW [Corynebacterium sp. SCR221107]WBT08147.1 radical SAM family heme chaperone HemW [Corynebacterium sp. SCR221107]
MTFSVYIHVPFCASRCGYCDFNTYTPAELSLPASPTVAQAAPNPASPAAYLDALEKELELAAASRASQGDTRPAETVFIGGGTPSMIGADGLARVLRAIQNTTGIAPGAEVTTEANPESTSPEFFEALARAGFTRVSLGMQSASASVLKVLERAHTPGRAFDAARQAGQFFEHVNLDMIYGTPTETDDDVRLTLEKVLETGVDHVSAYSLIVEDGTRMARKVRTGELPAPEEDVYADRYWMIDAALREAGFDWYEVSNWARPGGQCEHNLRYWRDADWWGAGPGAHSHLGERRFFNVKHPATYTKTIATGVLPIKDTETLSADQRHEEKLMLGLRLKEGVDEAVLSPRERAVSLRLSRLGLVRQAHGRIMLADDKRLLADGIIADILFDPE